MICFNWQFCGNILIIGWPWRRINNKDNFMTSSNICTTEINRYINNCQQQDLHGRQSHPSTTPKPESAAPSGWDSAASICVGGSGPEHDRNQLLRRPVSDSKPFFAVFCYGQGSNASWCPRCSQALKASGLWGYHGLSMVVHQSC